MSKNTKSSAVTRAEGLAAGTKKHYPNATDKLAFGGASYTVQEVTDKLQSVVTLREAAEAAQSAARARVATEKVQLPVLLVFMAAYEAFVKATFGDSPDALADFDLKPKKARTPLTAEQVAASVAKREATRAARGTKGPKAKLATKGAVTGVVVTPIVAGPPTVAPAPAPSASGGKTTSAAPAAPAAPSSNGGSAPHGS